MPKKVKTSTISKYFLEERHFHTGGEFVPYSTLQFNFEARTWSEIFVKLDRTNPSISALWWKEDHVNAEGFIFLNGIVDCLINWMNKVFRGRKDRKYLKCAKTSVAEWFHLTDSGNFILNERLFVFLC